MLKKSWTGSVSELVHLGFYETIKKPDNAPSNVIRYARKSIWEPNSVKVEMCKAHTTFTEEGLMLKLSTRIALSEFSFQL